MPQYEHDLFISYRRSDEDWVRWTRENFSRALGSLLRPGIGKVRIFQDEQIETGASWPNQLALSLSRSRLMVAVLSRDYFESQWCRLELAIMCDREKRNKLRTVRNPSGLIIPVIIDDGDHFPLEIAAMQGEKLHEFANPFIRVDSPKQEALAEVLRAKVCPAIERALLKVPKYNSSWETSTHKQFQQTFKIHAQSQTRLPSLRLRRTP
jgi:hypothetical protein